MNRWRAVRSGWWVGALLAALLWLPLMGALHQIVHGGSPPQAPESLNAVIVPSTSSGRTVGGASARADWGALRHAEGVENPSVPARAELIEAGGVRGVALVKAIAGLFSTHGSDADCRVFDQLCHGDLLISVATAALPALPVAICSSCRLPAPPDLASAVPTARGPPVLA